MRRTPRIRMRARPHDPPRLLGKSMFRRRIVDADSRLRSVFVVGVTAGATHRFLIDHDASVTHYFLSVARDVRRSGVTNEFGVFGA